MDVTSSPELEGKRSQGSWPQIIEAVKTPLGLLTAILLTLETLLGGIAAITTDQNRTYIIVGMLAIAVLMILVVVLMIQTNDDSRVNSAAPPVQLRRAVNQNILITTVGLATTAILSFYVGFYYKNYEIAKMRSDLELVEGRFLTGRGLPSDESSVDGTFVCRVGDVTGLRSGMHLWLATQPEDGFLWPKSEMKEGSDNWTGTVHERAPKFSVVLLVADDEGQRELKSYLHRARLSNIYGRTQWFSGTDIVAKINGLQLKQPSN